MDSLDKYRAKRDFKITAEPAGGAHKDAKQSSHANAKHEATFVIQRHHARRLHYDFRLEIDHTLKSWAIPKGPSLDPKDKRLAVHVEDHPLEYATFEGTIAPNQYGAGEVIAWDRGTWRLEGNSGDKGDKGDAAAATAYKAGKIKFELFGEKLHGHWTLVRTRLGQDQNTGSHAQTKENWLLIKERDAHARPAQEYNFTVALPDSVNNTARPENSTEESPQIRIPPKTKSAALMLPEKMQPQLATLAANVPSDDGWAYELKLDGYRILTRIDALGAIQTFTRNGLDWSKKLAAIVKALSDSGLQNCWLDGEIVMLGKDGRPSFQMLQNAFASNQTEAIQYYIFDILFADGRDLRVEPWAARRTILDAVIVKSKSPLIGVTEIHQTPVKELLNSVCHHGLEGLIGKRRDSPYESGRSSSWIKLKCLQRQEFVIGGFTNPQGARTGFGALLLGVYENDKLRYVGRVGTGFDESRLAEMHKSLKALEIKIAPFMNAPKNVGLSAAHWVKPILVAQISFAGWTATGSIRHAVFIALGDDKPAVQIIREVPKKISAVNGNTVPINKHGSVTTDSGLIVTHAHRVIDISTGLTKFDVVRYYEQIAPRMLPHLIDRPVAMLRVPDNIQGEQFFQKHLGKSAIAEALLLPDLDPGHAPLVALNTQSALVSAAQINVVEFHTWNATVKSMHHPDRLIFDLDPDPALPWEKVLEAAKLTRTILQELGLLSFLKTSGGNGLHVVVPLLRQHTWEASKEFAKAISQHLAKTIPALFIAKMGAQNRIGKVFVDYLRNTRGSTTVCAFSLRARPGLGVSLPISWIELDALKAPNEFNILNAQFFLKTQNKDPWAEYEKSRQSLVHAMKVLAALDP
jgi:bifunctional non-homologous end joining protein LigD